jgi:GrpB protein
LIHEPSNKRSPDGDGSETIRGCSGGWNERNHGKPRRRGERACDTCHKTRQRVGVASAPSAVVTTTHCGGRALTSDTRGRGQADRPPGGPRPTEREERQRWGRVRAGGGRWARGARRRTTRSSGPRARVARPAAADATVRCSNPQRDSRLMITLVPYDPAWPIMFEVEANQIRGVFRDLALRVEHVGSTAVPGLSAKPVIDIQASVACLTPFEPYLRLLASVGYPHVPLGEFDRVYPLLQIWDSGGNAR